MRASSAVKEARWLCPSRVPRPAIPASPGARRRLSTTAYRPPTRISVRIRTQSYPKAEPSGAQPGVRTSRDMKVAVGSISTRVVCR